MASRELFDATTGQRLRDTYLQSVEAVKRARARADLAADRARAMRSSMARLAPIPPDAEHGVSGLVQFVIEETDRASREKERFIAVVSHELRQPLNAILAAFQLLETEREGAVHDRAHGVMRRQLNQMARLLDDLLDLSRMSVRTLDLHVERCELRPIIESALETVAAQIAERRLALRICWGDPVWVRGDEARLIQVFSNLASNAVRYTCEGGSLELVVSSDSEYATVSLTDSGIGIDAGDLENIFEPFARGGTGSPDGFGIGLALVKGLVELHGGRVTAASPGRGQGSSFTIDLPHH